MQPQANLLSSIDQIYGQMSSACQQQRWHDIYLLDKQLKQQVQQLMTQLQADSTGGYINIETRKQARAILLQLSGLYTELCRHCQSQSKHLAQQLTTINSSKTAASRYLQVHSACG